MPVSAYLIFPVEAELEFFLWGGVEGCRERGPCGHMVTLDGPAAEGPP